MACAIRVTVVSNSNAISKRVAVKQTSLEELINYLKVRFDLDNSSKYILHDEYYCQVDDLDVIRDNDVLYLSTVEQALNPTHHHVATRKLKSTNSAENWITLNVGGREFVTTRETLVSKEPESMLARMFCHSSDSSTGCHDAAWLSSVDRNGAYLIDRSAEYFEPILNYLRHGQLILNKNVSARGVLEEAVFYGITSIMDELTSLTQEQQKPDDLTPVTRRELTMSLMTTPANCELRCQGLNFTGADLSRLDLRYVNFKYANLRDVNLSGANLSYCNFERSDMSGAVLDGANLLGIKMLCTQLENASLRGCNFEDPAGSRANMEGAAMKHVNLEGSRMASVNLRVATLRNSNLQNCDLRGAVLAGADLENCDMSGCDLQEANLRGANLKGVAFEMMLNPLHMSQTVK